MIKLGKPDRLARFVLLTGLLSITLLILGSCISEEPASLPTEAPVPTSVVDDADLQGTGEPTSTAVPTSAHAEGEVTAPAQGDPAREPEMSLQNIESTFNSPRL